MTISPISGISKPNGITGTLTGISNAGGISSQTGGAPVAAGYPLNDDGTVAALFGSAWLETDAPAYWNADYTYTGAATGGAAAAFPDATNVFGSQAITVGAGEILACECVINSAPGGNYEDIGLVVIFSSGGTPYGTANLYIRRLAGVDTWRGSGMLADLARPTAAAGFRLGVEIHGDGGAGSVVFRTTDGTVVSSVTFTTGTEVTFGLNAVDGGTTAAGQTASIALVPVGADMQLGYTTGATDFNGDPCPQGYAQWNRYDAKAGSVVSSNNLVFSSGAANDLYTIRGNVTKTVGGSEKPEFEITITSDSSSNLLIGVGIAGTTLPVYAGETVNSWGYLDVNGQMYHSGAPAAFGATYTTGDVLTFSLSGTSLLVKKNGASQGTITLSNGQVIQPIGTIYIPTDSLTINGGQTPLLYPEPGYDGGWPA